jgi:hypothetical protein
MAGSQVTGALSEAATELPDPADPAQAAEPAETAAPAEPVEPDEPDESGEPAGPPLRLTLMPAGTGPQRLDGTWWPRSHDLSRELPALLSALEERWPHITRITVSRSMWRVGPSRLLLNGRILRVNRSDVAHSPNAICLLSYGVGRCDLLVVPPGTSAPEGLQLMSAAEHEAR